MDRKTKLIALIVCALMTASGLFASGTNEAAGTGAKKITKVTLMTTQSRWKDVFNQMATAIKADTGYEVEFQVVPDDQVTLLVRAKLATGEVPDIIDYNVPTNNADLNVEANIVPLDNEPWIPRLINPKLIKDLVDGKIYALPSFSSSFYGAVYYNKDVFKKLGISEQQPKTYEEFLNVLRKIKNSGTGITPIYTSEKDSWTTQIFPTLGFGVSLADKQDVWSKLLTNKVKWSEVPEFKKILSDYMVLFNEGLVNKDHLSATYDMAKEALATGSAAMVLNGEWIVTDILSKVPDAKIGAWIVPFMDKNLMGSGRYVNGLFVTKKGNSEAARKFLDLWSQPKYQNMFFAALPGYPAFKDVDGGKTPEAVQKLVDNYIKTGKYTYEMNGVVPVTAPIQSELWKYYVEMSTGAITPEQVLEKWDRIYQDFMKSRKEPGF